MVGVRARVDCPIAGHTGLLSCASERVRERKPVPGRERERQREKKRTQGQVHLSRSSLARQFVRAPPSPPPPPPLLPHAAALLQSSTLTRPYFLLNLVQKRAKVKGKVCDPVTEEAEARRRDPLFTTRGPGGVSESGREDDTRGQDDTRTDVTCLPSSSRVSSIYLSHCLQSPTAASSIHPPSCLLAGLGDKQAFFLQGIHSHTSRSSGRL